MPLQLRTDDNDDDDNYDADSKLERSLATAETARPTSRRH